MPKSLARVQPIRASRPNRGRVPTKSCTTTKPSRMPIRVVQNKYPSRGLTNRRARARPSRRHGRHGPDTRTRPCRCPSTRPCTRSCRRPTRALGRPSTRPGTHPSTRPCMRSTRALGRVNARALGRAYAQHEHSAAQSCPSHLGPSVLHTLIYEDYVLLLLIYL